MTKVAFIVTLNLDDTSPTSLISESADILEDLTRSGHDVVEVKPWARQSLVGDTTTVGQQVAATPEGNDQPPPIQGLF